MYAKQLVLDENILFEVTGHKNMQEIQDCTTNGELDIGKVNKAFEIMCRRDNIILTRGDYVQCIPDDKRYRNDGTFAFDGEKLIDLNIEYCDYGVPPFLVISEFPIHYWENVHKHNSFILANLSLYRQSAQIVRMKDDFNEITSPRTEQFTH